MASTWSTTSYRACGCGCRCSSGVGVIVVVMSRYWRNVTGSTGAPFHRIVPLGSTTILFFTGSIGGGVISPVSTGRSSFTAWVWMGIVMMNMLRRTSMTSMSGVVLTSIKIGRESCWEGVCQYVYNSVVADSLKKKKYVK